MIYPSVGQYTEAIKLAEQSPEDYFATKTTLRPVLGADGNPVMSSGNFAVVFKMQDQNDGKIYALKCFTRDQEGRNESYRLIADELQYVESEYLTKIQYLENELFVDTGTDDTEFPVLLMDWVEGETLDKYIKNHINEQACLEILACDFAYLADWLLKQPFAHGDLKPDNIIVKDDGTLVIVDYDGMYVPKMRGQKARELGSPDFRHPQRTEDDFDEHIDDFAVVTILLSLKALSLNNKLLDALNAKGCVLLHTQDFSNLAQSAANQKLQELIYDKFFARIYAMFVVVLAERVIDMAMLESVIEEWNNPEIQYKFACYLYNLGIGEHKGYYVDDWKRTKYIPKALDHYLRAADQGYVKAQIDLGNLYLDLGDYYSDSITADYMAEAFIDEDPEFCTYYDTEKYEQAVLWYKKAVLQGDHNAMYKLGVCYEEGKGVSKNSRIAYEWYKKSAEQGNADSQYKCAERNYNEYYRSGYHFGWNDAFTYGFKAAVQGQIKAQHLLGSLYYRGILVDSEYGIWDNVDFDKAIEWWTKAAEKGDVDSQYDLGILFERVKDYRKAVEWWTKAAEKGNASAQNNLGICYEKGQGVTQDFQKALDFFAKSAKQGNENATRNLNRFIERMKKAADQGDINCQYILGIFYEREKDYKNAFEWYTKAAEQGNACAQNQLGYCYQEGRGVAKDYAKAIIWYTKAANQGDENAKRNLNRWSGIKYIVY